MIHTQTDNMRAQAIALRDEEREKENCVLWHLALNEDNRNYKRDRLHNRRNNFYYKR